MSGSGLFTIVIPTLGRRSLTALLDSLQASAASAGLALPAVYLVDDRPVGQREIPLPVLPSAQVLRTGGRGPAAARNAGWRACATPWVAFLDDDVVLTPSWLADLTRDLSSANAFIGGSQGELTVPLPEDRPADDWERGTAGLQSASWITADMAYRIDALRAVGGFDERFPGAFREDADLALAVLDAGYRLVRGSRRSLHPVRESDWWASVRQQRGNAADVLMWRLHGPGWRRRADAPLGRRPQHLLTTAAALAAAGSAVIGRRRAATLLSLGWLAATVEFCWHRIAPGPKDRAEVARMISTSLVIPPVATWHWLVGIWRYRGVRRRQLSRHRRMLPAAVLLDRDGTIIHDVPYNGDPAQVQSMPGARSALDRLRAAGIPLGVISNQSGIARGLIDAGQVAAVNARVEELLGPFDVWAICPHGDEDGCECRKPQPGLIYRAAEQLGVKPQECVVIGDIGADVDSARAADAHAILVPTERTRQAEVLAAPLRAATLADAVELVLTGGERR